MTSYHGGKQRIGSKIADTISRISTGISTEENFKIKGYCEPFCGMLGVYRYIPSLFQNKSLKYLAGDTNQDVILMWKRTQKGWKPPTTCTKVEYNSLKDSKRKSALRGYIGHQYSFGGQYFMGYAPDYGKKIDSSFASQNVTAIAKELKKVKFTYGDYTQFNNLSGFIIYCDPPYEGTSQRYKNLDFDIDEFWNWCREMSQDNIVFVSGYFAPRDFEKVFSSSHKLTGDIKSKNKKRTENLYVI